MQYSALRRLGTVGGALLRRGYLPTLLPIHLHPARGDVKAEVDRLTKFELWLETWDVFFPFEGERERTTGKALFLLFMT